LPDFPVRWSIGRKPSSDVAAQELLAQSFEDREQVHEWHEAKVHGLSVFGFGTNRVVKSDVERVLNGRATRADDVGNEIHPQFHRALIEELANQVALIL